jgi:hypothetical protein
VKAGPWASVHDPDWPERWERAAGPGDHAASVRVDEDGEITWSAWRPGRVPRRAGAGDGCASVDAAKEAADRALIEAGWSIETQ